MPALTSDTGWPPPEEDRPAPERAPPASSWTRFDRLVLTERFQHALERYLSSRPQRRAAVYRVMQGLLTDYRTLQRSPIRNRKHRLFHTRLSRSDRLVDLPITSGAEPQLEGAGRGESDGPAGQQGEASGRRRADKGAERRADSDAERQTLLLNLGDHSVNQWAQRYDGDVAQELGRSVVHVTAESLKAPERRQATPAAAPPEAGPRQAAAPGGPGSPGLEPLDSALLDRRGASSQEPPPCEPLRPSPWRRPEGVPGTYGEYLTEADLRYHGVPEELIPVVLRTSARTQLVEVGLEEPVADALETLYLDRLPSVSLPLPPPAVVRPEEPRRAEGVVVLSADQLAGYLRLPLHKFLAQVSDEQRRLIEREDTGLIIVKGAAGTGKTVVGIRRIEHLLMAASRPLRVLFLCYNQVLRDSAYQMLKDAIGNRPEDLGVAVRTAYQWLGELKARYLGGRLELKLTGWAELLDGLRALRADPAFPPPTRRMAKLSDAYIAEEFAEVIYGRAVPDEAAYVDPQKTPRPGRGTPLLPEERRYLWKLFEGFEEQAERQGMVPWEWLPYHLLSALPPSHPDWPLYDAVVVDEAQDLLPVVFRVLMRVQGGSDRGLMVLGDAAQNVYRSSFRWADTGLRVTGGHVTVLRRCYRTTRAIVEAARPLVAELRQNLADDLVEPEATELTGPAPDVLLADDEGAEVKEIAGRVFRLIEEGTPASSIAIFARGRQLLNQVARELQARGIPFEHYEKRDGRKSIDIFEPSVKLITTLSAKGIEFPTVFIVGVTEQLFPSRDRTPEQLERARRMLYTAMMRAAYRLTLSAVRAQASGLLRLIQQAGAHGQPG